MSTHELKCWTGFFQDILEERKTFEVRRDDREYSTGDILKLREFEPNAQRYTGRECICYVSYLLRGRLLPDGLVVMAIKLMDVGYQNLEGG